MNHCNKSFNKIKSIRAIIFDLDGTLLTGVDFKLLKKQLCIDEKLDVLEVLNTYSVEEKERVNKIIHEFELNARDQHQVVQEHVTSLLEFLEVNNIPKAIHSRNSLENIKHFVERVKPYTFHHLAGREIEPPKPNASGSLNILKVLNDSHFSKLQLPLIKPNEILFVGDSIDDITTSNNFGSISMLLVNEHNKKHIEKADYYISNFKELKDILNLNLFNNNNSNNNL